MLRCWGDRKGEFYWLTRNAAPSAPFGFDSTFFSLSPRSPVCRRVPLRRYAPVCNDYRSRSLDRFQSASSPREGFDEEKGRTKKYIYIFSATRDSRRERVDPMLWAPRFRYRRGIYRRERHSSFTFSLCASVSCRETEMARNTSSY